MKEMSRLAERIDDCDYRLGRSFKVCVRACGCAVQVPRLRSRRGGFACVWITWRACQGARWRQDSVDSCRLIEKGTSFRGWFGSRATHARTTAVHGTLNHDLLIARHTTNHRSCG